MSECGVCNSKAVIFPVMVNEKEVRACAKCITSKHLTGWSL
jgi:hypothetical protein